MSVTLGKALEVLRANEPMLRARGVVHAAVFGSVARGEAGAESDLDLLVDLEDGKPSGIFEYVRLQLDIAALLGCDVDLVERKALRRIRAETLRDKVDVF